MPRSSVLALAIVMFCLRAAAAGEPECGNGTDCAEQGSKCESSGDFLKAEGFFEKACRLENALGCYKLGSLYWSDARIRRDVAKALPYMEQGCRLQNAEACMSLGDLYFTDEEFQDLPKAKTFNNKACRLGSGMGCVNLGYLYTMDLKDALVDEKMLILFEKGCNLGTGRAATLSLPYMRKGLMYPRILKRPVLFTTGHAAWILLSDAAISHLFITTAGAWSRITTRVSGLWRKPANSITDLGVWDSGIRMTACRAFLKMAQRRL